MPTIKPVKAHVIVDCKGSILPETVRDNEVSSKLALHKGAVADWPDFYQHGYRCTPVTVSPLKKKGRGK